MILYALILVPLAFAAYAALGSPRNARGTALVGTLAALALAVVAVAQFNWFPSAAETEGLYGPQFEASVPLLPAAGGDVRPELVRAELGGGINLSVGVDSVAMLLIALTALLGPVAVLCSWTAIDTKPRTFFAWLLVLQAAMTGVFAARDLVFFYVCFEFTLIPMWVMIHLFGSTNRAKAATRFFLYTFTGSIVALAGLVYVAWKGAAATGVWNFDIGHLQAIAQGMSATEQAWVLLALLAGFAVKVPLFPVHTWLPLAHTEAPTAGSVILAGVLLKLGTYGLYRFALPFAPHAIVEYAPILAGLCVVGILYGGLICWVQKDVKKLVAYSSVAHLGFCVLGLVALNATGITGSILYMINHGLSTGALFVLIGMVYERYHTRDMNELGGLAARMPIWATFMVFFTMASVGLPGLNGFVSEFLCLMGAFQASNQWQAQGLVGGTPGRLGFWVALVAGTGMIIAAIYLLYMLGRVVWGTLKLPPGFDTAAGDHGHGHGHGDAHGEAHGHAHADAHGHGAHGGHHGSHSALPTDLNAREVITLLPLAAGCLILGVYPKPILDTLQKPVGETVQLVQRGHARLAAPAQAASSATPAPATPAAAAPQEGPR